MKKEFKELIKKRASLTVFATHLNIMDVLKLGPIETTELQMGTAKLEGLYDQFDEVK